MTSEIIGLLVLSGVAGFGVYCVSCAFHVWRARNKRDKVPASFRQQAAVALCITGAATIAITVLQHSFFPAEGVIQAYRIFSVPAQPGMAVEFIAQASQIKEGDVLLRLSPFQREVNTDSKMIEGIQAVFPEVLPDSPLTRQLQEVHAWQRQLQLSLTEMEIERARMDRETMSQRLEREDELARVELELARSIRELSQAQARADFLAAQLGRGNALFVDGTVSREELQKLRSEAWVITNEVDKLEISRSTLETRKGQLEKALELLLLSGSEHKRRLDSRIASCENQLAMFSAAQQSLVKTTDKLTITAPFSGRIIYRSPSGGAGLDMPVVAMAATNGCKAVVRMSASEAAAIKPEEQLRFIAGARSQSKSDRQLPYLERGFLGSLVSVEPVAAEPGTVLATFLCDPPSEVIVDCLKGEVVGCQLKWHPPLWRGPGLYFGFFALLVCLPLWKGAKASVEIDQSPKTTEQYVELGKALRRELLHGTCDSLLLAEIQRNLGASGLEASRLISAGVQWDDKLTQQLRHHMDADRLSPEIVNLLSTIAPEKVKNCMSRPAAVAVGPATTTQLV